jgi:hypothetical protein
MINEIKMRGFEKIKKEIEDKELIKKNLELNIDKLQKRLNLVNAQAKNFGTHNTKYEEETNQFNKLNLVNTYYI